MTFKKMLFKGKSVFVEVDDSGRIVETGGRANMKYRLEDNRIYNPAVANLNKDNDPVGTGELFSQGGGNLGAKTAAARKPVASRTAIASRPAVPSDAIVAYTDGGCIGNPGPSGLGYVIRYPDNRMVKKGEPLGSGTNNIAELTAIYRVLQLVTDKSAPLRIHTDSSYAIGVLTQGWKAKANQQLIAEIRAALSRFSNVQLIKVKGHAGNPDNELVDQLANGAARTQQVQ
ncbi:MAG: ribonuclease HI [Deltaproteobacteria bacterium]|nr:ribonuclease HI [Deltaproteobacteria bacterium]